MWLEDKRKLKMENKTTAQIAKENNWVVGTKLKASEEARFDRHFMITAIGLQKVLGIPTDMTKVNEFELSLTDPFITWAKEG